jgi:GNAT superfamily N-acetyltransferase
MKTKQEIVLAIANYSTDRMVHKELGEPLFYDENDVWIFLPNAFGCVNKNKLKYLYTEPNYRSLGKGSSILEQFDDYCHDNKIKELKTIAPISRKDFYVKRGWEVTATLTNWIKIKKSYGY